MQNSSFLVIGHPIGHTMSPFIHQRLFALRGKTAEYGVKDIPIMDAEAFAQLRPLRGFNVTIPHKTTVIPFLDRLDRKAEVFGSVNTVSNDGGVLTGYTTDGIGFLHAIEAEGASVSGKVLMLGSGGAARVVAYETALAGGELTIAARSPEKAELLARDVRDAVPGSRIRCLPLSDLETQREEYDLAVNTTPVGMYPKTGVSVIPKEVISRCSAVFDAVYNPDQTEFIRLAEKCGKTAVRGMAMLVWQAAAAHTIWDGSTYTAEEIDTICRDAVADMERSFYAKKEGEE